MQRYTPHCTVYLASLQDGEAQKRQLLEQCSALAAAPARVDTSICKMLTLADPWQGWLPCTADMMSHCAKAWHRGASEGSMAAAMGLRPMHVVHGSAQSSFAGTVRCFSNLSIACRPSHCRQPLTVEGECTDCFVTSRRTC